MTSGRPAVLGRPRQGCLIGELHLKNGDYQKAIEAFSRAIATNPTIDAYEGRARAHRALAIQDERNAQQLRGEP